MYKPDIDRIRLEPVLTRHLGQVHAPDALWERIQNPRPLRSQGASPSLTWAVVAAGLALMAMIGFHSRERLEFRSDEATRIRGWVKTTTGLDVPLPAEPAPEVRLISACAIRTGTPSVEIAYRVGNRDATLRVSKAAPVPSGEGGTSELGHQFMKNESSWVMRGQLYSLAYADVNDFHAACLLCHAGGERL